MKDLLQKHVGTEIGINLIKAFRIEPVTLLSVHDDYFTVDSAHDGNVYHLPYLNIVKILENPDGVTVPGFFRQHKTLPFVVKIGHVVEYVPS
jgi:hypothetical protein